MKLLIQHISKSYGKTRALDDVSLELSSGVYALLGPNGSGKSTLMNILSQNLSADSGQVLVDGQDITRMGAAYRALLGFMPQYPGLYPTFTVREMLFYMAKLKKVPIDRAARQIPELLAVTELSEYADRRVGALSGGMKQRLCLAQALLGDPKLLILDEPTAGMDPKQRVNMRQYIASIAQDKIVLLATHLVEDVECIAHRVVLLRRGQVVGCASVADTVASVTGKVWQITCPSDDLAMWQRQYPVIGVTTSGNELALRVLTDAPPSNAVPLAPTLEDCYLYTFRDVLPNETRTVRN